LKKETEKQDKINAGYRRLANAVVMQAVKDYRRMLEIHRRNPSDETAADELGRLEEFFHSQLFGLMADVSPDYLIKKLKGENANGC